MNGRNHRLGVWAVVAGLALGASLLVGCKKSPYDKEPEPDATGTYAALDNLLPKTKEIDQAWVRATDAIAHYLPASQITPPAPGAKADEAAPKDLASSPAGADAPLFAEYGHKVSVVQQYLKKNAATTITVQVHQMDDPNDAFGIFSVSAAGERMAGSWTAARKSAGIVAFAKGPYYVVVREQANPEYKPGKDEGPAPAIEPLEAFAEAVANKIYAAPALPLALRNLPSANQTAGSEVYVRGPLGVGKLTSLPIADRKSLVQALGLAGESRVTVALATYKPIGGANNTVFVASYPTSDEATTAAGNLNTYLQSATPAERNAVACQAAKSYVVGTFNAEEESVQRVLPKVISDLGG
jgi:hypothetical protein